MTKHWLSYCPGTKSHQLKYSVITNLTSSSCIPYKSVHFTGEIYVYVNTSMNFVTNADTCYR